MGRDQLDQTLGLQLLEGNTGKRTVDAQTINQDRGGDQLVGRDFLVQLVIGSLVEADGVVGLFLDLTLGPLLLLLLAGSRLTRSSCLCLYMRSISYKEKKIE